MQSIQTVPKYANLDIHKEKEFQLFVAWKQMPPSFRRMNDEQLSRMNLNEEHFELADISSKREFAKRYKVSRATLDSWEQKIDEAKIETYKPPQWARNASSDVLFALYKRAVKYGRAAEVKAWFDIVEPAWNKEKTQVTQNNILLNDPNYMAQFIKQVET